MAVRRELWDEECIYIRGCDDLGRDKVFKNNESKGYRPEDLFEEIFLGSCYGVGLSRRGPDDNHVCFTILCEDDNTWFIKDAGNAGSSFWLPDLMRALRAAQKWLKENAKPDIPKNKSWPKGVQCGWMFKPKKKRKKK